MNFYSLFTNFSSAFYCSLNDDNEWFSRSSEFQCYMNRSPANDTCLDQKDDDVSCLPRPKSSSWAPQLQCHTWWSRLVILTSYQMLKWSTGTERIHSWSYFSGEVFLRKRQVGTSFLIMDWGFCVDIMSSMLFGSERRNVIFIKKNPYFKIDKNFPKGLLMMIYKVGPRFT